MHIFVLVEALRIDLVVIFANNVGSVGLSQESIVDFKIVSEVTWSLQQNFIIFRGLCQSLFMRIRILRVCASFNYYRDEYYI